MHPLHTLDVINSSLASTLRRWRGTTGSTKTVQPAKLPEIYDREGCPRCRLVREAITELNLNVLVYPCPEGGTRYTARLEKLSGALALPFLYDPNNRQKLAGAQAIIDYLFSQYRGKPAPSALRENFINLAASSLSGKLRGNRGQQVKASRPASKNLTLYSFESSPFSRPVRERLCEYELAYQLVNLSKQQLADLGPSVRRLHFGEYKPLPGTKREAFLSQHGRVQVPFLVDPNTDTEMFESLNILKYLDDRYAAT